MKKIITILCILIVNSGCQTVKYQYKDKSLPTDKIARIRADNGSDWHELLSDYMELSKPIEQRKWKSIGNHFSGFSSRLNLLPGRYLIRFYCNGGQILAYPSADVVVETGKLYSARCYNAGNQQIGVEVTEATDSQVVL